MAMKNLLFLVPLAGLLAGCTTVTKYESKSEASVAKPADYPIYLYPKEVRVPRPYEVVGVMAIRDTLFTVFGGSFASEVAELRQRARKVGADAVQLTSVEQPDFMHAKYRIEANLIRFTDPWENLPLTEEEFAAYLRTQEEVLDPIEGVWSANDAMRSRVGIIRNQVRSGRDFVAFILNTQNPTWQRGDKKLELASGERPGVYRGVYYLDDYHRKGVAFSLMGARTNVFVLPMTEADQPVVFAKE